MKISIFSAAAVASTLLTLAPTHITAANATCNNPVFIDDWGVDPRLNLTNLIFPSEPQPFPEDAKVCTYYQGQDVCCSSSMLDIFYTSFSIANETLQLMRKAINQEHSILGLMEQLEAMGQSGISKRTTHLGELMTDLANYQLDCVEVLTAYTQGMTCFACEPDFQKFIDDKEKVIEIAKSTCNSVVDKCSPVFNTVNEMMKYSFDTVHEFASFMPDFMKDEFDKMPDMCGGTFAEPGDCSDYVCDTWLNGVGIPQYVWDPMGDADRVMSNGVNLLRGIITDEPATSNAPAITTPTTATLTASSTTNKYTNNGYDALSVGCADATCPNISNLTWLWVILGLLGGSLGLFLIYYGARRCLNKRERSTGERQPLATGTDANATVRV